jgi:hypothetical protein
MNQKEFSFLVEGKDAKSCTDEIKAIFKEEFDIEPEILADKPFNQKNGIKLTGVEIVAVAALLLAIPGALLAVSDLIDKIRKKEKLDRSIKRIQKDIVERHEVTVKIIYPDGTIKLLNRVDTNEMFELSSKEGDE